MESNHLIDVNDARFAVQETSIPCEPHELLLALRTCTETHPEITFSLSMPLVGRGFASEEWMAWLCSPNVIPEVLLIPEYHDEWFDDVYYFHPPDVMTRNVDLRARLL